VSEPQDRPNRHSRNANSDFWAGLDRLRKICVPFFGSEILLFAPRKSFALLPLEELPIT